MERKNFGFSYETVAISQTDQVMGVTGAKGDYLERVIVTVITSGATGIVSIKDGSGSAINIVVSGQAVGTISIPIGCRSVSGAWKITTGAAATAIGIGIFS